MSNIYEQGYQDELINLQDSLIDIKNTLTSMYTIKDEIWRRRKRLDYELPKWKK